MLAYYSQLDKLEIVDLKQTNVNGDISADDAIASTCCNIRSLDLSGTLVSSLQGVANITAHLPRLEVLRLKLVP